MVDILKQVEYEFLIIENEKRKICSVISELENRWINFLNFVSSLGAEILTNIAKENVIKSIIQMEIQYKGGNFTLLQS